MSRQLVDTKFPEYEGPVSVTATATFQDVLEKYGGFNGGTLMAAGQKVSGFTSLGHMPLTEDGYTWFWGGNFQTASGGKIAVLIPWSQDWNRRDGSQADRAVAVYTNGTVSINEVEEVLQQFGNAFQALKEQMLEEYRRNPPPPDIGI